jgi:hypothetical protein
MKHTFGLGLLCLSLLAHSGPCQVTRSSESEEAHKNEYRWPIASHRGARLVHGWISFDETGGELAVREHVGGGASRSPLDEPLELVLRTQAKGGFLHLQMIRQWDDRSASLASKTSCPKGITMRTKDPMPFSGLTTEYRVLWREDFVRAGEIVKSVAYVARLSPIAEQCDGFGRQEVAKIKAALHKSEGLNANNGMQADPRTSGR